MACIVTQLPASPQVRAITIEDPTASEDLSFFHTARELVVTQMNFVITGSNSVTITVRHDTDRSAAGTEIITGGTVADQTTDEEVTSLNNPVIPAGSWVWVETTAVGAPRPTSVNVSLIF